MEKQHVLELLTNVRSGLISPEDALEKLALLPYEDLSYAKLDHHRAIRTGFPEVVFGEGKTATQVVGIVDGLARNNATVLVTRTSETAQTALTGRFPDAVCNTTARTIVVNQRERHLKGGVLVVTAGTSDIAVAEEAAVTAQVMSSHVNRIDDVGAAGIHRLLAQMKKLREAHVIIAVAGMDGVLPTLIGGLVSVPVIAVPTSVGYGASFKGIAPLLTMLNSCSPGVCAVNIDNGFGAGYIAAVINLMGHEGYDSAKQDTT